MSRACEIEDKAALWLIRREELDWNEADQAALDAWLQESMAHKAAYWRLEHGWRQADRISALGANAARAGGSPSRWWRPAVAASLIAALIGFATIERAPDSVAPVQIVQARYQTPVGGRKAVPLADGSRIELNTATLLRTAVTKESRDVWLDQGEAYFEVAKRDGQRFIVHAGAQTVTVLGTKFSVRRDRDRVVVSVLEGRVRIDDGAQPAATRSSTIAAGDMAIARGASTLIALKSEKRVESALAWREGMLVFDQAALADVAAEFNRYNRKSILVADPEAARVRIGGTFKASNVDAFVRLLRDAYGLAIEERADGVRISS